MKKKTMKILAFVLLITLAFTTTVMAEGTKPDLMDPNSVTATTSNLSNSVGSIMNDALGVVQVVAIVLAVIMLIVLGIKYITAAPAEKADIKKGAMIYVVGAALMFGATAILQIIKTFAGSIS